MLNSGAKCQHTQSGIKLKGFKVALQYSLLFSPPNTILSNHMNGCNGLCKSPDHYLQVVSGHLESRFLSFKTDHTAKQQICVTTFRVWVYFFFFKKK